jgi:hypothetical protein
MQPPHRRLHELFDGREDAFRWACEYACAQIVGPMEEAAETGECWEARVEAMIAALLGAAAAQPTLAELYLVHSVAELGLDPFGERGIVPTLTRTLEEAPAQPHAAPKRLAEMLAHGVVSLLTWRLLDRETKALELPPELSRELTILVLVPYRANAPGAAGTTPSRRLRT